MITSTKKAKARLVSSSLFFLFVWHSLLSPLSLQADTLKLTTVDWQPFFGHDIPEKGFFSAITREAFNRAGYDIKIEFQPWKRALETTIKGDYDGLLGAYFNEARASKLHYSDVVFENQDIFITKRKDLIDYQDLNELKAYRIAVMRGAAYAEELKHKGFNIIENNHELQSLKMLCKGRVDVVLMSKMHFQYISENDAEIFSERETLAILKKPFRVYPLYVPITKKRSDSQEVIDRFNDALTEIKTDGTYQKILGRFGF
ncbi:MAG: substrate-binding periplasmic protein [Oleiphilus sp.]